MLLILNDNIMIIKEIYSKNDTIRFIIENYKMLC